MTSVTNSSMSDPNVLGAIFGVVVIGTGVVILLHPPTRTACGQVVLKQIPWLKEQAKIFSSNILKSVTKYD